LDADGTLGFDLFVEFIGGAGAGVLGGEVDAVHIAGEITYSDGGGLTSWEHAWGGGAGHSRLGS
jgi:hypothetical protein